MILEVLFRFNNKYKSGYSSYSLRVALLYLRKLSVEKGKEMRLTVQIKYTSNNKKISILVIDFIGEKCFRIVRY